MNFHVSRTWIRLMAVVLLGAFAALTHAGNFKSAGADAGWGYYGLLPAEPPANEPEKWRDLAFTINGNEPASKKPAVGMALTSKMFLNIRGGAVVTKPDGGFEWPSAVGVLTPGTVVKVTEVKYYAAKEGTHFWVKVRKENP